MGVCREDVPHGIVLTCHHSRDRAVLHAIGACREALHESVRAQLQSFSVRDEVFPAANSVASSSQI